MIPTRIHGVLDYLVGALLIVAPYLLGFADSTAAQWTPMILGAAAIIYSLITDYELSVAKVVPLRVHLGLDIASGIVLAVSPWLFGFADRIWWPHVLVGIIEVIVSLATARSANR